MIKMRRDSYFLMNKILRKHWGKKFDEFIIGVMTQYDRTYGEALKEWKFLHPLILKS